MTRHELYEMISPCGTLAYLDMLTLLSIVEYTDPQIGYLLIQRLTTHGKFTQEDWILFARSVVFLPDSPIDADIVESWFVGKCSLTGLELKTFLEFVSFTDGSLPTYLLSETGDFLVSEQ
jgi:hypothetical protein